VGGGIRVKGRGRGGEGPEAGGWRSGRGRILWNVGTQLVHPSRSFRIISFLATWGPLLSSASLNSTATELAMCRGKRSGRKHSQLKVTITKTINNQTKLIIIFSQSMLVEVL
jgi:hypothetical protein